MKNEIINIDGVDYDSNGLELGISSCGYAGVCYDTSNGLYIAFVIIKQEDRHLYTRENHTVHISKHECPLDAAFTRECFMKDFHSNMEILESGNNYETEIPTPNFEYDPINATHYKKAKRQQKIHQKAQRKNTKFDKSVDNITNLINTLGDEDLKEVFSTQTIEYRFVINAVLHSKKLTLVDLSDATKQTLRPKVNTIVNLYDATQELLNII